MGGVGLTFSLGRLGVSDNLSVVGFTVFFGIGLRVGEKDISTGENALGSMDSGPGVEGDINGLLVVGGLKVGRDDVGLEVADCAVVGLREIVVEGA